MLLDGKPIGQVDSFMNGLDMRWFPVPAPQPGPALKLSAGKHVVRLAVSNAISKEIGWVHPRRVLAIDRMVLTDDAAFAPKPLGGGTEAQAGVNLKEAAALKAETQTVQAGKTLSLPLNLGDHSVTLLRISPAE